MQKMGGVDYILSRNEDIRRFIGKLVEKQTLHYIFLISIVFIGKQILFSHGIPEMILFISFRLLTKYTLIDRSLKVTCHGHSWLP